MSDQELKAKFDELYASIELLLKAVTDQQLLNIRMMAHQQAHLAALRSLLVQNGEDRGMLNQKLRSAYETAVNLFHDQLQAYYESGDAKTFVASLVFPDDIQSS